MPHRFWTRTLATSVAVAGSGLAAFSAAPAFAASVSTVSGTLTVAGTTAALSDVQVELVTAGGQPALTCGTGSDPDCVATASGSGSSGTFSITDVPAGSYYVYFYDATAGDNDTPVYAGAAATLASATPISVDGTNPATVAATTMPAGATVSGTVTDSGSGAPVDAEGAVLLVPTPESANVNQWEPPAGYPVQSNGTYSAAGVPAGTYEVQYSGDTTGTKPYPEVLLAGSGITQTTNAATAITLTVGGGATANFSVPEAGSISGSVAAAGTNAPLGGLEVQAFNASGEVVAEQQTTATGTYTLAGLLPGSYSVEAVPSASSLVSLPGSNLIPYAFQFFTGEPDLAAATAITVAADQTHPNVNFALRAPANISGTVVNARGGAVLPNVRVSLLDAAGNVLETTITGWNGAYTLANLPAGKFYVEFGTSSELADLEPAAVFEPYTPEFYGGKPSLAGAKAVTVKAGGAVTKINGELVASSSAAIGLPTESGGKLSGLRKDKVALSFKFAPGSGNSADVSQLAVALPSGLRWATKSLKKDLSLGKTKFTYAVKKGTLTLTFQAGQRGATLTVRAGGVTDTKAVRAKAKAKKLASEKVGIKVTTSQGLTTSLSYTVKQPS